MKVAGERIPALGVHPSGQGLQTAQIPCKGTDHRLIIHLDPVVFQCLLQVLENVLSHTVCCYHSTISLLPVLFCFFFHSINYPTVYMEGQGCKDSCVGASRYSRAVRFSSYATPTAVGAVQDFCRRQNIARAARLHGGPFLRATNGIPTGIQSVNQMTA